jgi:biotin carboxylase
VGSARKPRVAVVYDSGSASPTQIAKGLRDVASIVFVVARSAHVQSVMPLLEQFGEVEPLDEALASGPISWSADGIVTFSERLLPATARLAELLDLPQHTPCCASALTNKELQRQFLAASGVDALRFATADSPGSLAAALEEIGYPAVIKPRRGEGSSHTYLVRDQEDGHRLIQQLERRWPDAGSGPLVLMVEEYLHGAPPRPGIGDFISVESAIQGGTARHMAVTGKFPLAAPFRETGNFWPPAIGEDEIAGIRSLATRALQALGVRSGIAHTEIKLTKDGPRIIEINGRLGGGIAELAQWVGGCDLITVAGRIALGETANIPSLNPPDVRFQYHHASPQEAFRVSWIDGHRAVGALGEVYRYSRVRLPAEVSAVSTTWFDTLLGRADTHAQMADALERAGEALEFGFEFQDGIHAFSGAELQSRAQARI